MPAEGVVVAFTLVDTQSYANVQAQFATAPLPGFGAVEAAVAEQAAVQTDISTTGVSLDPVAWGGILASIRGYAAARGPAFAEDENTAVAATLKDLGQTLSQGQGAYYVAFQQGAGGVSLSLTPSQFAKLAAGGTVPQLSPEDSFYPALQAAFRQYNQDQRSAGLAEQAVAPGLTDGQIALSLLQRKPAAVKATEAATPPAGSNQLSSATQLQTTSFDGQKVTLTVVYVPPSEAATTDVQTAQTSTFQLDTTA